MSKDRGEVYLLHSSDIAFPNPIAVGYRITDVNQYVFVKKIVPNKKILSESCSDSSGSSSVFPHTESEGLPLRLFESFFASSSLDPHQSLSPDYAEE
tara:strand:- start:686 stop:976 length:291 start_codon:yes stop_codon:yes gene_type:complete